MATYLIVPGLHGSAEGHWQHHWLEDMPDSFLVEQALWSVVVEQDWLATLQDAAIAHPGSVLIAHSMGCLIAARLADWPGARHVAGAILVAPCDPGETSRLHPGQVDVGSLPQERLPFPSVVVASRNDPYMRFERAEEFADALGAGIVDLGHAGHINVASGYGRWEEGYALASGFTPGIAPRNTVGVVHQDRNSARF